jgi:ActR/RegA family two-component response regulator
MKRHAILIVEDDETLSNQYKLFCQIAINNLRSEGFLVDIDVLQAFSIEAAVRDFDSHLVDFISLDLALHKGEYHLQSSDRKQGREASGMAFLKSLRDKNEKTNVIIVSGETLMSYSIEALQKYGVLAFYQKDELNAQEYISALQASLWYQSTMEVLSRLENFETHPDEIERAEKYWQNALKMAKTANIDPNRFASPEARIAALRGQLDHMTGLPIGEWVKKMLVKYILRQAEWSLCEVEITNLGAFEEAHASQVAPLSAYVADKLREIPTKFNYRDVFIGKYRFGHRDAYIVIFKLNIGDKGQQIINWLYTDFKNDAWKFTPALPLEIGSGQPVIVPELGIKIWYSDSSNFPDVPEIIDALGKGMA